MPSYRVIGKWIYRCQTRERAMLDDDGELVSITESTGSPVRIEMGTVLDDVTAEELLAHPDRFEEV